MLVHIPIRRFIESKRVVYLGNTANGLERRFACLRVVTRATVIAYVPWISSYIKINVTHATLKMISRWEKDQSRINVPVPRYGRTVSAYPLWLAFLLPRRIHHNTGATENCNNRPADSGLL